MAAEGISNHQIAKRLPVSRPTVLLWRQRFATLERGVLVRNPEGGRSTSYSLAQIPQLSEGEKIEQARNKTDGAAKEKKRWLFITLSEDLLTVRDPNSGRNERRRPRTTG